MCGFVRAIKERLLNLLLLLTALFASLSGAGAADRAVRQVQGVAVVQSVGVAQAAVKSAQRALPGVSIPHPAQVHQARWSLSDARALPVARLPFERRLE